jgi:DNA-binding LacI/PurR family transcriptional regulator
MASERAGEGRVTIVDVARAAGVSRQTVSNALNNPEKVAAETLERVQREVERLGFTLNVAAQQLRRRRASAYGFQLNPSGSARMGHVLDEFLVELTSEAPRHGSHVVVFTPNADDVLDGYRHMLGTGLVDGFVLADTRPGDPRPQWLLERQVPFVAFGRIWDSPQLRRWVDVDGRAGMRKAVAHLVGAGYRQIAFLGWPAGSPVGDDRRQGWLDGLQAAGLADRPVVEESVQDLDEATSAAERVIARLGGDAAVACASDLLALGAMRAARNHGLAPGPDIGVLGFDDTDVAEALQLTSVRQPLRESARAAWNLLLPENGEGTASRLLVPDLTIRTTTTRARPTSGPRTNNTHMEGTT